MYRVELSPRARRFFERAPLELQRRLDGCFARLADEPRRQAQSKALRGPLAGYWRFRLGDYRALYRIDDPAQLVTVTLIAHRREAYR